MKERFFMLKQKLSSRERMLAAIKCQNSDYIPFSPYISQGPWFKKPLFWTSQFERAERMLELGLDPVIEIWMPDVYPHFDVEIKVKRENKAGEVFLTKEYHTPAGILRQVVCETEDWCTSRHGPWIPTTLGNEKRQSYEMHLFDDYNVSRRTEPWVKNYEDLDKLKYLILPPENHILDEWRMDTERAIEFARKHELLTIFRRTVVGDAYQWFCDIPWFMTQLYDNPKFVKQFFNIFQQWSLKLINLALELDVDVFQYRGWYETPPFWSPDLLREYILPNVQEQVELVHSAGKCHTYLLPEGQGAFTEVLKTLKTDVLQGIDPRKLHGGDMRALFSNHGVQKAFWGGVNAEVSLESKNAKFIDEAVKEAIETLGKNGGLILSSFCFPEVPTESIVLMIEAWKKYRFATS